MASDWLPGCRLVRHPNPDAAIELARAWIERSSDEVEDDRNQHQDLPKRLVDVSQRDGSIVYLKDFCETSTHDVAPKGFYACLSHRWDSIRLLTTTTATYSARMEGIPVSDLPQTFRDAIYITRGLGLQYIWIDSLCILQDSKEYWEAESAKMGAYYTSSWLTIGADVESSKGCFATREVTPDVLRYFKMVLGGPEGGILYFTDCLATDSLGNEQGSILRQRAWAFQEEVMSPRYLGFQKNQMFYRCGSYIEFEDGFLEWLDRPGLGGFSGKIPLRRNDLLHRSWFAFVEDYSDIQAGP
jgi:Heterokaryon incompatibility protein (HET)